MRTLLLAVVLLSISACTQGPQGSQGPEGQQGPQGPQGPQGVAFNPADAYCRTVHGAVLTPPYGNIIVEATCDSFNDLLLTGSCNVPDETVYLYQSKPFMGILSSWACNWYPKSGTMPHDLPGAEVTVCCIKRP